MISFLATVQAVALVLSGAHTSFRLTMCQALCHELDTGQGLQFLATVLKELLLCELGEGTKVLKNLRRYLTVSQFSHEVDYTESPAVTCSFSRAGQLARF